MVTWSSLCIEELQNLYDSVLCYWDDKIYELQWDRHIACWNVWRNVVGNVKRRDNWMR